jgi:hypothetical protein
MSTLHTTPPGLRLFRAAFLGFAFVLACQAMWVLLAEAYRPVRSVFPADPQTAAAESAGRNAAALAATLAFVRGDLWAECAITYLGLFWNEDRGGGNLEIPASIERVSDITERALALSPHDAGTWLVLASIDLRFDWLNRRAGAALRMSYYTGANETELIPLRLWLAVRSDAIGDPDFQQLVSHDIRVVATREPALEPVILTAYRGALPSARRFLEETLEEIDPNLLAKIHSDG